ncbi:hypothetical protein K4U78_10915 [Staphylococcus epidermidis]|uniref:hypothetical protein n=1 Tax=Staphylococcus TaxID=1279 RepID=UPI00026BF531|nr:MULTISPECIES: hypothetical protein [Staphylococcus]MDU1594365.1 hypothetical protein [Staphylococcus lugdunensis]MDU7208232.1 hypothetical protein [Enterococcus faecalis]AIR83912.1 hypothetical protein DP17_2407 [Staphylococcus epidermidis]EJE17510.1 hypothetical protein HMPREF9980_00637 [Staphylococcus epidermidis NIHLM031]KAB2190035.1 hypothetical protein F9B24_11500 [Staphylococcus epidermidis]
MNWIFFIILLFSMIYIFMYIKKLEKLVISQTGLPLLTKVQKLQSYCVNQNNFFICLSIHCSICEKIIREYNKTSNLRNNVFIIFTEDKAEIQKYLKSIDFRHSENRIIYELTDEDLLLEVTPFLYELNTKGEVINKAMINSYKEIA